MPNLRNLKFEDLKKREHMLVQKIVSIVNTVNERFLEGNTANDLRTLRDKLHTLNNKLEKVREEIEYRKGEIL